ncbi:MAG TPA: hypothetical protein VFP63_08200 [Dehalococcoidia bacterium]|nr:hypothetical protein [Dehalococcoidia bacterium]
MTDTTTCIVCGEPADEDSSQLCNNCESRFHLRLREDIDGKDCGEVWVNEQYMSLEFACFTCLGKAQSTAGAEPPVGRGH